MNSRKLLLLTKHNINKPDNNIINNIINKPDNNIINNIINKPNNNIINNIINSGPYEFKIFIGKQLFPHSVNLNKITINYYINDKIMSRIIYLSTGHSFAELKMQFNNITIRKVENINDILTLNDNIYYSIDNNNDDFCLIYFGKLNIENNNYMIINNIEYTISNIVKTIDIKMLETNILIKNGFSSGISYTIPIIDFLSDKYLISKIKNFTYFTFKINNMIVIVQSNINSGLIVKGTTSSIEKVNGITNNNIIINEQQSYYFYNTINNFKHHELFKNIDNFNTIKQYYLEYVKTNKLSIVSTMGDSGSGFYKLNDNSLELVGINIAGCSLIILSENENFIYKNKLYWDDAIKKLRFNKYIIEEVHKSCHVIPIYQIENSVKNLSNIKIENFTI